MRVVMRDLMKDGKDINEILDMPYDFVIEVLREKEQAVRRVHDEDEVERMLDRM